MGKGLKGGEDSLRVGDQEELTQGRQRACPAVCSRAMSGSPGVGEGSLDPVTPMSCLSQSPGRPVDRPEVSERQSGQWKTGKPEPPSPQMASSCPTQPSAWALAAHCLTFNALVTETPAPFMRTAQSLFFGCTLIYLTNPMLKNF